MKQHKLRSPEECFDLSASRVRVSVELHTTHPPRPLVQVILTKEEDARLMVSGNDWGAGIFYQPVNQSTRRALAAAPIFGYSKHLFSTHFFTSPALRWIVSITKG
ncbi:hypothetical protein Pcinc_038677 [Petrolisthes cinctipes]|uniref:Uncharacterized protein n=1 Tax=Petrolisthes cinctipes TaxID=88211 RepID=A0AAE1BQ71_PETCI|nr:hypothetical protein Pcinc_038677 [Petrolisthes cinctipes]